MILSGQPVPESQRNASDILWNRWLNELRLSEHSKEKWKAPPIISTVFLITDDIQQQLQQHFLVYQGV